MECKHLNNYASPEDAAAHARAAGLEDIKTWLRPEVVTFPDDAGLGSFLGGGLLSPYLTGVDEQRRKEVVTSVVRALPDRSVRFVRLNVVGRTPLAK